MVQPEPVVARAVALTAKPAKPAQRAMVGPVGRLEQVVTPGTTGFSLLVSSLAVAAEAVVAHLVLSRPSPNGL